MTPHKRIHMRVPINGVVILFNENGIPTRTEAINISQGGIGAVNPDHPLDDATYQIEVITEDAKQINLTATVVYKDEQHIGFKTSDIDNKNLQVIADLVEKFQTTEKFIEYIDKHNLLKQYLIDDAGNKVSVTFDIKPEERQMNLDELEKRLSTIEEKQKIAEGLTEIAVGFARDTCGTETYFEYLRSVLENDLASDNAKDMARLILQENAKWHNELFERSRQ